MSSYKDINITESHVKLKETKEYMDLKSELVDKLLNDEISNRDVDHELKKLLKTMINYMKSKRRREKPKIIEKVKDFEEISIKYKDNYNFRIDELEDHEIYILMYDNIPIKLPTTKFIKEIRQKTLKDSKIEDLDKHNIYAYISLEVSGNTVFHRFIKKVNINNSEDKIKEEIEKRIRECVNDMHNYEENTSQLLVNKTIITITIGKWESIENWFKNHDRRKKYNKYKDFTLFLASGEDNCLKQCVEELGGKWDNSKALEEMIPQSKIINYSPVDGIENLLEMKDLLSDNDENSLTNDCKNIARLVRYNNHVGVITKIRTFTPRTKIQSTKRLNTVESDSKEIYMDIEAFTEVIDKKNSRQVPYLICWGDNDNNLDEREGKDCIKQFVNEMIKLSKTEKEIIIYAWYGSGYDFQHIISHFKDKDCRCRAIIKNSSIIFTEIFFEYLDFKITLKDPYLFLLTSLDKASKAFKVLNKGSFPHSIIKDWDDLNRILPYWVKIQRKIVEEKSDNKVGLVVKSENIEIYESDKNYKTILEKAKEYCRVDVLAMKEVWIKFKRLMKENLGLTINNFIFTLSQMSMTLMESCLEKGVKLMVPSKEEYSFIKDAIYGGRVVANNGIYNEDILYADVVSLYPSAMKLLDHGYGEPIKVDKINFEKQGIYKVKLTHKNDSEPANYFNFVARKINGRLTWKWFKEYIGTYHTYDLLIAKREGYNIEFIEGIEYENKGKIFNNFIDKLYNLKEEHSSCKCGENPCPIRMIAKIALNGGGYGKFVQRPIEKDVLIVLRDVVAGECDKLKIDEEGRIMLNGAKINMPLFYNLDGEKYDKMVIERNEKPSYATQVGVSILSGSRYRLYNLCKKFPNIKIIYSDTDSIYVLKSTVDEEEFKRVCNKELGSLDNEIEGSLDNKINEMVIGGAKMYAYTYKNKENEEKIKLYCKGVPNNMLNYKQIKRMVNNNEVIAYHFEILKRKLISVNSMNIEKHIRQTTGYNPNEINILDFMLS